MSEEQIEHICNDFARPRGPPRPHGMHIRHHCDRLPALLPSEMDYLVNLLVPFATTPRGLDGLVYCGQIDWDAVAASFNDRFSGCEPRKVKVLRCAMSKNYHRVTIVILRERCRKAHQGENNAGTYHSLTSAELEYRLTKRKTGTVMKACGF